MLWAQQVFTPTVRGKAERPLPAVRAPRRRWWANSFATC